MDDGDTEKSDVFERGELFRWVAWMGALAFCLIFWGVVTGVVYSAF